MFRGLGFGVYCKAKNLKVGPWGKYDPVGVAIFFCRAMAVITAYHKASWLCSLSDVGKILGFVQH